MQSDFDFDLHFLPPLSARGALAKVLIGYAAQTIRMIGLLIAKRPDVLWIQAPPTFLVHLVWLARLASFGNLIVVADLHNSALSKRWLTLPLTRRLLNTLDVVIVHNEAMRRTAADRGINTARLCVLEDRMPVFKATAAVATDRPRFVMPCSFYFDEPVRNVIEAARRMPEFEFMITGDRSRAATKGYLADRPENVTFTDFLPSADYERLLSSAVGIICLTTEDGVQLSAASEAAAAGKPMLISDTQLLRSLFASGLFVDNSVRSLINACRAVVTDYERYAADSASLRSDCARSERWLVQAETVKSFLTRDTPAVGDR